MKIIVLLFTAACAFAQNTHTVVIIPDAADANLGKVRFLEKRANGANYIDILGQASLSANRTLTIPDKDGTMVVEELDSVVRISNLEVIGTGPGNYTTVRHLVINDLIGLNAGWDFIALVASGLGGSSLKIRDNSGVNVLQFNRAVSGVATNYTNVYTDWLPDTTDTLKLGDTTQRWLEIHGQDAFFDHATIVRFENLINTRTLRPYLDDTYSLGASGGRYTKLWVKDVDISGTCTGCSNSSSNVSVENNDPIIQMKELDASTDGKYWRFTVGAERFDLQAVNDAYTSAAQIFSIPRSGSVLSPIEFSVGVDPANDLIQGLGNPLKQWVNIYGGKVILSDTYPMILSGTGFKYFPSESSHVAWYKKDGAQDFYWRRSATGYPGSETELMALSDAGLLTLYGNFVPNGVRDIGTNAGRWNVMYANNLDGAPSGTTGNYMKTRKVTVVDDDGGTGAWDIQAKQQAGNSYLWIRDGGGSTVLRFIKNFVGAPDNSANFYTDVRPAAGGLGIGLSSARWGDAYISALNMAGSLAFSANNTYSIGSTSVRPANTYTSNLDFNGVFSVSGQTFPASNNTFDLGSSGLRFANGYFTNINVSGTCTGCSSTPSNMMTTDTTQTVTGAKTFSNTITLSSGSGFIAGNIVPSLNATYFLGNVGKAFSGVYTRLLDVDTSTGGSALVVTLGSGSAMRPSGINMSLGTGSFPWQDLEVNTVFAHQNVLPDSDLGADIGSVSLRFNTVRAQTYYALGTAGASTTLACAAGLAVKNITVSGGIVTAVSCGAP